MTTPDSTPHAKFSPSKLPRIIRCPGSAQLCENIDQKESSAASEGSYLHSVVEDHLTREEYFVTDSLHQDPVKHADYKNAVEEILQFVFRLKASNTGAADFTEHIENYVSLKDFASHFICEDLVDVAGTLDYSLLANRTLWVCDWKFGKGVKVYPDTEQLKAYACGEIKSIARAGLIDRVICVIGQPRLGDQAFEEQEYTTQELLDWLDQYLAPALKLTHSPTPVLHPSEKACKWCLVSCRCKARHDMAMGVAEQVFAIHAKLPNDVSLDDLREVLDKIPMLDQYTKDITNYAFNLIKNGNSLPGYKLVSGRSIRKWVDEVLAKEILEREGYDVSTLSEVKFFGPAKVEKIIGKRSKEDFFQQLVVKPTGAPTLTMDIDKREALKFDSASEVFANYADETEE